MAEILMLHGNGGGKTRFKPFLKHIYRHDIPLSVQVPDLSGFEGRPIPEADNYWDVFVRDIAKTIDPAKEMDSVRTWNRRIHAPRMGIQRIPLT